MREERYTLLISPALYADLKKIADYHHESVLETIRAFFKSGLLGELGCSDTHRGIIWLEHAGKSQHADADSSIEQRGV